MANIEQSKPQSSKKPRRWTLAARFARIKKKNWFVALGLLVAFTAVLGGLADNLKKVIELFPVAEKKADEISKIRNQVEEHRNAIGMIVRDANAAQGELGRVSKLAESGQAEVASLIQKSGELQDLLAKANAATDEIKAIADFTFLSAKVDADDRHAFDAVLAIAKRKDDPFRDHSLGILKRAAERIRFAQPVRWDLYGVDLTTADFESLKACLERASKPQKPDVLTAICGEERLPKFDRCKLLAETIRSTDQLSLLSAACALMNVHAKLERNVIAYEEYLEWWYKNMNQLSGLSELKN